MNTQTKPTRKFTAETAIQFDHFSQTNAMILSLACRDCIPYEDWFTYNRWIALGMQVQKGQHGTKLTVYIEKVDKDDEKKTYTFPHTTTVFCRHQVAEVKEQ